MEYSAAGGGQLMTRREILKSAGLTTVVLTGCDPWSRHVPESILKEEARGNIAILGPPRMSVALRRGEHLGRLLLTDSSDDIAVSLLADAVAWIPGSSLFSIAFPKNPTVMFRLLDGVDRRLDLGVHAVAVAISSNAKVFAIGVTGGLSGPKLLVVREGYRGGEDITPLLPEFRMDSIERLSISVDGACLVVGSRNSFAVVDLIQRRVLLRSRGRFPALSPDGERLAFVKDGTLLLQGVRSNRAEEVLPNYRCVGTSQWSPDGAFLLLGARRKIDLWHWLWVFEVSSKYCWPLTRLGEGDFGNRYFWVSRQFLSL